MKKISIILLVLSLFIVAGCEKEKDTKTNKITSNGTTVDTSKMEHKHCTRQAKMTGGDVSLNYDLYYTGDVLNILKSEEKVISSSDEILDTYEEAYKKIAAKYDGIEYYDANVIRGDTTVTNSVTINYDNIDVDKIINIEGSEDNIFENKVAKVEKWLALAKRFGTKCEIVEE